MSIPTVFEFKAQAKALRAICAERGIAMSHSAALEALAKQYGFRDWNAACAAAPKPRQEGFSSGSIPNLFAGDPGVLPGARRFDPDKELRELRKSIDEIANSRSWMTADEAGERLGELHEEIEFVRTLPDWKRSDGYGIWLGQMDGFLHEVMDWAEDSLAVAVSTVATLSYRMPFHLGRMPSLAAFRDRYEVWLRDPTKSRAAVEEHFPEIARALAEADARTRDEVRRVLVDPALTDEEAEAEADTRNHEITRMEERLERIQAAALDAQERGDVEAYDSLMGDHIELEGRIERAHDEDAYEEE